MQRQPVVTVTAVKVAEEAEPQHSSVLVTREQGQDCGALCRVELNGQMLQYTVPRNAAVGAQFQVYAGEPQLLARGRNTQTCKIGCADDRPAGFRGQPAGLAAGLAWGAIGGRTAAEAAAEA